MLKWTLKEEVPGFLYEPYRKHNINPFIAKILFNRGLKEDSAVDRYLNPSLKDIHEPELLPNIKDAAQRLKIAIDKREKILLFGDYDVDGITGTSILYHVLKTLGAYVSGYIPNRFHDGYGISVSPLERIFYDTDAPAVVISIDNGVVAFEAANFLQSKKIDFVVADHHRMADDGSLPPAMIVHPGIPGSAYPNKNLCGAGVAFKLAWATAKAVKNTDKLPAELKSLFIDLTTLVAMGTIADIVPLTEENRLLVSYGLKQFERTNFAGVKALVEASKVSFPLKAGNVAFHLAPKINAAGRLGSGGRGFDLLVSNEPGNSAIIAAELGLENDKRRELESSITDQVFLQVRSVYGDNPKNAALILYDKEWHEGVVGIVAARVVDAFHRPALVLSMLEDGQTAKGSGRTALGVDMKEALDECKDLLMKYGGHESAVGLSLKIEHLDELRERFALACAKQLGYDQPILHDHEEELKIDAEINLAEVDFDFICQLNKLEPCGMGNKRPIFSSIVKLAGQPELMGKQKNHLSFNIEGSGRIFKCVMWKRDDLYPKLLEFSQTPIAHPFRIAYKPEINEFAGRRQVQLMVIDFSFPTVG